MASRSSRFFIWTFVFLSHNSKDKAAVKWLAAKLADQEKLKVFLDIWNLIPGDPWQEDPACYLSDEEIGVTGEHERLQVTPYRGTIRIKQA